MTDSPLKTAGETTLEAIAREIDYSARGVNGCDYAAVIAVGKAIRHIGFRHAVLEKSPAEVKAMVLHTFEHLAPTIDDRYGIVTMMRERIERVDLEDPIGPFSDNAAWWPYNVLDDAARMELFYRRNPRLRPDPKRTAERGYIAVESAAFGLKHRGSETPLAERRGDA